MSQWNSAEYLDFLVFTDLDGTLLDHETYSFELALPAIHLLKKKNIPLILCSSKTRAEIKEIRIQLKNKHPFISENGGAIFIPKKYFSHEFYYTKEDHNYLLIELGTSYPKLREILHQMKTQVQGKITGFGDISAQEVAKICGLSLSQAKLAIEREYDEPFFLENAEDEKKIQKMAGRANLRITRGGRFYHLIGKNDKGKAVTILQHMYQEKSRHMKSIGLGDSINDLPLFEAVDYPVLVQKKDGSFDPSIKLKNLVLAPGPGPKGWHDAILKLLNKRS